MAGGGGGGGSSQFKAQGPPPSFDYQSAMGLQQQAVGGDIQSYALSDQDFANRYPALQQAYQNYQANLNQQTGQVAQGQTGQSALMSGLANTVAGRQATPTTSDITGIQNAAATAGQATQPIFGLGASQAGLAQPLIGLGQQQAGLAAPITGLGMQQAGIGNQIGGTAAQMGAQAQIPYRVGQQLLGEPIDPNTQQQMMRAGLSSASGALGAASLGQGMAGQAAAARQLGLNTLQYGQAMRGEAMSDIGQSNSMLGAAGQMQGLGASTVGAGANTIGLGGQQLTQGGQLMGLGGAQLAQGAQTYGLGANTAATTGGLYGAAQGAQEQYGMDTAQMAQMYGGLQSQQAMNMLGNIQNTGNLFQKRPFGLGGTNMAQADLGQAGAYNSFQQANYATMNGIAFNQAQMNAQQQQLQAQQSAGMMSAGVGAAGAVASAAAAAAAISCWVARECLGTSDSRWKAFRLWLINFAPDSLRVLYLRHGEAFADSLAGKPLLKALIRHLMLVVLKTQKSRGSLLTLNYLLCA